MTVWFVRHTHSCSVHTFSTRYCRGVRDEWIFPQPLGVPVAIPCVVIPKQIGCALSMWSFLFHTVTYCSDTQARFLPFGRSNKCLYIFIPLFSSCPLPCGNGKGKRPNPNCSRSRFTHAQLSMAGCLQYSVANLWWSTRGGEMLRKIQETVVYCDWSWFVPWR